MNMVRSDTYRILKSVGFKVYLAILLFNYAITIYCKESGGITIGGQAMSRTFDIFKIDRQMVARNCSFYYFFIIPIFVIIMADFSTGAIKNSLSSAFSRTRYFVLKFLYSLSFILVSFTVANMLFWAVNKLINGSKYSSGFGDYAKAVCLQLPLCLAISSLFVLLAFLIRKAAIFNTVTIILPFVYVSVTSIIGLMGKFSKVVEFMSKAYYDTVFCNLAADPSGAYITKVFAGCGAIIVLSFVLGLRIFKKSEF